MRVEYQYCCGLDVHKETVVACAIVPGAKGKATKETCTFSTMTEVCAVCHMDADKRGHACGHGKHWGLLETDLQHTRRRV